MTNIDDVRESLNNTIDEQAATIARLERERDEATRKLGCELAKLERELAEAKPKADSLDALTTWLDVGVVEAQICKGVGGTWGVVLCEVACYREGNGPNLAAAIMDAVRKATT